MNRPFAHLAAVISLAVASLAVGCTASSVQNEAEPPAPETTAAPAADAPADAPAEAPKDPATAPATGEIGKTGLGPATPVEGKAEAAKGSKGDGASCDKAEECTSGICEGEGCGAGQGKCAPKDRPCTRDLRPYCGCDGKTFQSSGSCPGARFSKKAACDGDKVAPAAPKP